MDCRGQVGFTVDDDAGLRENRENLAPICVEKNWMGRATTMEVGTQPFTSSGYDRVVVPVKSVAWEGCADDASARRVWQAGEGLPVARLQDVPTVQDDCCSR